MDQSQLSVFCCTLCRKNLTPGIGSSNFEAICSDCKFLISEDASFIQESQQRVLRRQRNSQSSLESGDSFFFLHDNSASWGSSGFESDYYVDNIGSEASASILSTRVSDIRSFSAYSGDSEASLNRQSSIDMELLSHADEEDFSDSDMDPMETGLDQWIYADGYDDPYEMEDSSQYLPESESSRQGRPPTATSFIENIPLLIIAREHLTNSDSTCVICKDPYTIGDEVAELPCLHIYHPPCILPWLRARNSCPLCRYELPTKYTSHDVVARENYTNSITMESSSTGTSTQWSFNTAAATIMTFVGIMLVVWMKKPRPSRVQDRQWRPF